MTFACDWLRCVNDKKNEGYNETLHCYFIPVSASYFMTYHTILKTSEDYINALKDAREISDNITKTLNKDGGHYKVFPYR